MSLDEPDFDPHYHELAASPSRPPATHKSLDENSLGTIPIILDRDAAIVDSPWVSRRDSDHDGKVACVLLVHHAYVDGVGAAWLMQQFYQPEVGVKAGSAPAYDPPPLPSWVTRLGWALRDWPEVMIGNLPKVAVGLSRKFMLDRKRKLAGLPAHPSAGQMRQTRSTSSSALAAPLSVTASRWSALSP